MHINESIKRWLKLGALVLLVASISACSPDTSAEVEEQVALTMTAYIGSLPTSTNTEVPQPTPIPTDTPLPPTETAVPLPDLQVMQPSELPATLPPKETCLRLLSPESGIRLSNLTKQTFEWEAHPGAANYRLEFISPPYHSNQSFETDQTSLYRWVNTLPWEGEYFWQVSALDSDGAVICTSNQKSFSKSRFNPTATHDVSGLNNRFVITPGPSITPCW